jgi:DNA-binding MarR family transcriptional regulator
VPFNQAAFTLEMHTIVQQLDYQDTGLYHGVVTNAPTDQLSMPVLLRHAHAVYGARMRDALAEASYDDIPENGLYVVGGLARQKGGRPLSELISELGMSKQAAGQLVDALVVRGYLKREPDPADRRRLTITLTDRGRAAARTIGAARDAVDAALTARVGAKEAERTRRTLAALIAIDRERRVGNQDDRAHS